jgi:hypothetical protein
MCPEPVEGHSAVCKCIPRASTSSALMTQCALSLSKCALSLSKGTSHTCIPSRFDKLSAHKCALSLSKGTLRQAQRAFTRSCPQISLSTLQPASPISMITRCRGSTFFAAPMAPSTSAVPAILNLDYSSTPSVGLTRTQGLVDRWRWHGLKNVSMSRMRTCSNARSKDGGARRSSR